MVHENVVIIYTYIYIYKEHLVEIIYTLVGSELLKKKLISS